MAQFRAVIFDLGGVLVPSPMEYWTKELEPSLGLPRGSVSACLLSDPVLPLFHQLEQGQLSLEDFEPLFTHFYNRQNGTKQQQQQQQPRIRLFSGHRDWARPHPGWEPILQRLRAAGFRTALCTNNFFVDRASCEDTLPSNLDRTLFDVVVESCRLGIRKPGTAIFTQTLAKLGVSAEEAIFIDDLGSNLKAARAMGIHTVKCSDPSQCQVELQRLLGLDVMPEAPPGTREPTEAERLPLQPLLQYFHAKFGLESAKSDNNNQNQMMHVRKFANGQSNPSYHIRLLGDGREFVLRKKPPGKLLPSAHRIEREFRVQCALKGRVPVPEMLDFVEGVLPTPFYLMQFCRGRIFQDPNLPELKEQQRTEVWRGAAQVLAQIHSVEPARVGLADFGKRGHYFRRNLLRMEAELGQAKERNELARRVLAWLLENCPPAEEEGGGDGIVHGDFRLDNLIWFHDRLEVEAVLDWELSTLGDPLSDLANFLLPFHLPPRWDGQMLMRGVRPAANGIPRPEQLIQAYLQARADLGQPEPRANQLLAHQSPLLRFGLVYVLFRNAVILHGVHARFRRGQASNAAAARQLADVPEQLLALAWAQIGQSAQPMGQQQLATAFPLSPEMMRPAAFALYCQVRDFIAEHVMAKEHQIAEWARDERTRWTVSPVIEELKNLARQSGLWNLFITEHLDPEAKFGGRGLSTAEYGHICELMGRCLWAPEVFNCSAPDTGNMEVLIKYGSGQQRRQFLEPLLQGKVRSCFAMTEPDVASSDATNIQGSIVRDGEDHFLLNSRKWFTSGAADPRCRLCLFMGRILPVPAAAEATPLHRRQSILLVPMPAPGLSVVRTLSVLDNLGDPPGGHCELLFENVRVPVANMVLGEGRGFEIAQGRLGPGRIHHCMRLLGHAERALELMRAWARCRLVGGGPGGGKEPLTQKQSVRLQLAESRLALEQARLLVLKAAHLIDSRGPKAAAAEIAMIKVATPRTVLTILDRGIQLFGAAGLSQDWPLAQFFVWARALRLADGPDVVHLETVAKRELAKL